jgi:hypothetical protein
MGQIAEVPLAINLSVLDAYRLLNYAVALSR